MTDNTTRVIKLANGENIVCTCIPTRTDATSQTVHIVHPVKMELMNRIIKLEKLIVGEDLKKPDQAATAVIDTMEIFIPLKGLIDINKEISRLEKQVLDMNGRLSAVSKKLENKNFIDRAPKDIIAHEQKKQIDYNEQLQKLQDNLNSLIK